MGNKTVEKQQKEQMVLVVLISSGVYWMIQSKTNHLELAEGFFSYRSLCTAVIVIGI